MTRGTLSSASEREEGRIALGVCGLATQAGRLRHVGPAHVAGARADARRGAHSRGLGRAAVVGCARKILSISFYLFGFFILYFLYSN
jgi:hypothetical protein